MSSSRATTGPLLGRLAAAAGAAVRGSNIVGGRAIVVGVESSSTLLFNAGLQRRPHATSSWIKLFKPAQAFFGGSGGSGSAASTSAVSAAAVSPVAAVPPQFGFAASAPAASAACATRVSLPTPKKATAAAKGAAPAKRDAKKKKERVPRGPSAYALFLKEQLAAASAAGELRSFAQRSAAVAAAWKSLPAASRTRFEAASEAAKLALPPREAKPVRALSGYQLFVREKLPTLRDERSAGGGVVSAMKAVAAAWSSAPAQVKGEFAARAKAMGTKR